MRARVWAQGVALQICQPHTHTHRDWETHAYAACLAFYLWLLRVKLHSKAFNWKHTQKDFPSRSFPFPPFEDLYNFCSSAAKRLTHTHTCMWGRSGMGGHLSMLFVACFDGCTRTRLSCKLRLIVWNGIYLWFLRLALRICSDSPLYLSPKLARNLCRHSRGALN